MTFWGVYNRINFTGVCEPLIVTGLGLDDTLPMLITIITTHCNDLCTLVYCVITRSNYTKMFSFNYTGRVLIMDSGHV